MPDLPRSEYPRPQFQREEWLCLNGEWQFELDQGDSGLARGLKDKELDGRIIMPFCPESELSGIGHVDFIEACWYRRQVDIPSRWAGQRILLHFQAVDYDATVWVNGKEVGRHRGGWSPFTCDLAGAAAAGETATIVVRARDPKGMPRPGGKQSNHQYENAGCHYTRTTGIWQTVWLEPVPEIHLKRLRITPDVAGRRFRIEQPISNNVAGLLLKATLTDEAGPVASETVSAETDLASSLELVIPPNRVRLWGPGQPFLYGLELELTDAQGNTLDRAASYAGLRSIAIEGKKVKLNGKPVFQRQVLDQGYYPDGILTAPSDEALRKDIELSMAAGFNAARLHQKVFEERFLYHADRLGYLVWGEFGDWGFRERTGARGSRTNHHSHSVTTSMITQWLEILERDYSHPCIIGWCPLNETAENREDSIMTLDDVTRGLFLATKAMDLSRPVLDTSGYSHRVPEADVYDCHDYDQNPESFRKRHQGLAIGKPYTNPDRDKPAEERNGSAWSIPYHGQPFFVSEFGGIKWNPKTQLDTNARNASWGYGEAPRDIEEFHARFEALCNILLDDPDMFGYCYTQLTDVFQEQNGIFFFDRSSKFDLERLSKVQTRKAAIET